MSIGRIDASFGTNGKIMETLTSSTAGQFGHSYNCVKVLSTGKILAGGFTKQNMVSFDKRFFLTRYNANGTIDTTFGTNGYVKTDLNANDDEAIAMEIQTDDKIVVVGTKTTSPSGPYTTDIAVIRYNSNGTLDTTFGTSGIFTLTLGTISIATCVAIDYVSGQPKIFVGGYTYTSGTNKHDFFILKLNQNGVLATSQFGSPNGYIISNFNNGDDKIRAIQIKSNGDIIVSGYSYLNNICYTTLLKIDSTGTFLNWGETGLGYTLSTLDVSGGSTCMIIDTTDGGFLVGGGTVAPPTPTNNLILAKYTVGGILDTTFGTNGSTIINMSGASCITSIAQLPNNKIIAGGYASSDGSKNFVIVRYNSNGTVDTTFGTNGIIIKNDYTTGDEAINGLAIQSSDYKVVLAGSTTPLGSNPQATVLRYHILSSNELKILGYSITHLKTNQYTTQEIISAGFTTLLLKTDGNYSVSDIRQYGNYNIQEIKTGGYLDEQILAGGYDTVTLKNASYLFDQIKQAGYSFEQLKEAFSFTEFQEEGYSYYYYYFEEELPISPICFVKSTPVLTDQGNISIEEINPNIHTINKNKIIALTKTLSLQKNLVKIQKNAFGFNVPSQDTIMSNNHGIIYNNKLVCAKDLIGIIDGISSIKYDGDALYNVLLKDHNIMMVNNMPVETLDPKNIISKLYSGKYDLEQQKKLTKCINSIIKSNNHEKYNKLYKNM